MGVSFRIRIYTLLSLAFGENDSHSIDDSSARSWNHYFPDSIVFSQRSKIRAFDDGELKQSGDKYKEDDNGE